MTSCVSFDQTPANRLPRPAGRAFTVPNDFGASPLQWLLWLMPQRLAYLRSQYTRDYTRETSAQYEARLRSTEAAITTRAVQAMPRAPRPAGDIAANAEHGALGSYTGENLYGTSGGKGSDTGSGTTGGRDNTRDIANTVSGILGESADTIRTAMREAGSTERARIAAASAEKIAELGQQLNASTNPAEQSAIQRQIDAVNAALERMAAGSGMSTGTIVGLVIGGIVILGGGAYILMNRRPAQFAGPARHNPIVVDARGHRHFIPAWRQPSGM